MAQQTIQGTVAGVTTAPYTTQHGTLNKHSITVNTANGSVIVEKSTKPQTLFQLNVGEPVTVTFEESQYQAPNGNMYTNRKIVQNGLVRLSLPQQPQQSFTPSPAPAGNPSYGQAPAQQQSFQPAQNGNNKGDGARNGMIIKEAVNLATSRKADATLKDLISAAQDIQTLTKFVEQGILPEGTVDDLSADTDASF